MTFYLTEEAKLDYELKVIQSAELLQSLGHMTDQQYVDYLEYCNRLINNGTTSSIEALKTAIKNTQAIITMIHNTTRNERSVIIDNLKCKKENNQCCSKCNVNFVKYERRTTLSCGCKYHKQCKSQTEKCDKCVPKQEEVVQEEDHKHEDCSICLEQLDNENDIITTKCNHKFHKECLSEWKKVNNTCPLCRGKLTAERKRYTNALFTHFENNQSSSNYLFGNQYFEQVRRRRQQLERQNIESMSLFEYMRSQQ